MQGRRTTRSKVQNVHTRLGGSKVFHCPSCGFTRFAKTGMAMHGIFLKALRDTASITFTGEACYRCIVREYLG